MARQGHATWSRPGRCRWQSPFGLVVTQPLWTQVLDDPWRLLPLAPLLPLASTGRMMMMSFTLSARTRTRTMTRTTTKTKRKRTLVAVEQQPDRQEDHCLALYVQVQLLVQPHRQVACQSRQQVERLPDRQVEVERQPDRQVEVERLPDRQVEVERLPDRQVRRRQEDHCLASYVQVQLLGQPRRQVACQPRHPSRHPLRRPSNTAAKNGKDPKVQVPKVQVLKVQVPKVQIQKVQVRKNEVEAATAKTTTLLNIWGNLRVKTLELDLDTQVLDLDMLDTLAPDTLSLDTLELALDTLKLALDTLELALDTLDQLDTLELALDTLDQLDHRHQ